MNQEPAQEYLKNYISKTNRLLTNFLKEAIDKAQRLGKIPGESLTRFSRIASLGKRIRGALVVLGYELSGSSVDKNIFDTSLFIELFHSGILVHDDIMDEDPLRRGLPSLHKQFEEVGKKIKVSTSPSHYGQSLAISIGDVAFYLSWEKLLSSNFPKERIIEAGKIYADFVINLAYGQTLDVTNISLTSLSQEDILKVYRYKTAEYTGILPLLIGATLGGLKDQKKQRALKKYGLALGFAFQIKDDLIGLFGLEEEIGKPIGSDLREGKNTLLMLHLAKHGTEEQKKFQRKVLRNKNITKEDVFEMQKVLRESGSYQYVINLSHQYTKEGRKYIPFITKNYKLQTILSSFLDYTIARTH